MLTIRTRSSRLCTELFLIAFSAFCFLLTKLTSVYEAMLTLMGLPSGLVKEDRLSVLLDCNDCKLMLVLGN